MSWVLELTVRASRLRPRSSRDRPGRSVIRRPGRLSAVPGHPVWHSNLTATMTISKPYLRIVPAPSRSTTWAAEIRLDRALGAIALGISAPIAFVQSWPDGSPLWLVLVAAALMLLIQRSTAGVIWVGVVAVAFAVPATSALLVSLLVAVPAAVVARARGAAAVEVLVDFLAMMTAVLIGVAIAGPAGDRSTLGVLVGAVVAGHVYAAAWVGAARWFGVARERYRWVPPDYVGGVRNSAFAAAVAGAMGHLVALAVGPSGDFVWPVISWIIVPAALAGLAVTVAAEVSRPVLDRLREDSIDARLRQLELAGLAVRARVERIAAKTLAIGRRSGLSRTACDALVDAVVFGNPDPDGGATSVRIIEIVSAYDRMTTPRPGWPGLRRDRALSELRRSHTRPLAVEILDNLEAVVAGDADPPTPVEVTLEAADA